MPNTLQTFLASATRKAAADLVEALLRIPEDKRSWSPDGKARTALDQVAECAMLNGYAVDLIQTRKWGDMDFEAYIGEKNRLAASEWDSLHTLLQTNTEKVIAVIGQVPDSDLDVEITMPWSKQSLAEVLAYPYWNMTYHTGQINYIASMLGCLN